MTCHDKCLSPRSRLSKVTQLRLNLQVKCLNQILLRKHVLKFQTSEKTLWVVKIQWLLHHLWYNITNPTICSLIYRLTKLTSLTCSSSRISTLTLVSLEGSLITYWRAQMKIWFHTVLHSWISKMIQFLRLSAKMIHSSTHRAKLWMRLYTRITSLQHSENTHQIRLNLLFAK